MALTFPASPIAIATRGLIAVAGGETPDYPDVGNVTTDDTVNGSAGTFAVPAVGDVESGVQFGEDGTEYTGTLETGVISSDCDETLTIYRATQSYGSGGMATPSWASQGTFSGHWQPASGKTERAEEGRKIKSEAFIIASRTASVNEDDKITRAGGETMYVNYVKKYAGHQTIFLKKTAGQN